MKAKPKKSGSVPRGAARPAAVPTIRTILTATDFSDHSRAGVQYAVSLGERLEATVDVVFVIEPPPRLAGMEAVALVRPDSEVTALARAELEKVAKRESKGAVRLGSSVLTGKPFHEITKMARARAVDLIVIATHGHTGLKHFLLGSTAERVIRHAPCPVLTVPSRSPGGKVVKPPPFKLKKILVPIDFSNLSRDAVPYATFVARQFGAEIILLHVVEHLPIDDLLGLEQSAEALAATIKQAEARLGEMAENLGQLAGVKASGLVRDGTPFQEICAAASARGADLVVLTTRGQTGLTHVLLGSTAERVVRHAPCPVMAVRESNFISPRRVAAASR